MVLASASRERQLVGLDGGRLMGGTGEFRGGSVATVRLSTGEAEELRWAARESGLSASELLRRGLKHVLPVIRADWYVRNGTRDEDWEPVAAEAGKSVLSSFALMQGVD